MISVTALHQLKAPGEIDLDDCIPILVGHGLDCAPSDDSGIVYQDVDASEKFMNLPDSLPDFGPVGDITADGNRLPLFRFNLLSSFFQCFSGPYPPEPPWPLPG